MLLSPLFAWLLYSSIELSSENTSSKKLSLTIPVRILVSLYLFIATLITAVIFLICVIRLKPIYAELYTL